MTLTVETDTGQRQDELWQAVMAGDEYAARDVVVVALDAGLAAESVLLDVVGAVQRRVGVEWAAARITVAQEHAATAINDRAALPAWLHFYNHHRPHSATAGQPPITRLTNLPEHHI